MSLGLVDWGRHILFESNFIFSCLDNVRQGYMFRPRLRLVS
jgi:hypothetical protein